MGQLWSRPTVTGTLKMPSDRFNFRKLPAVAQRKVLKHLNLIDLINFSQISHKSYASVQDAVIKVVKCGLELQKKTVSFIVQYDVPDERLTVVLGKHGFYPLEGSIMYGKVVFNGEKFDYHFDSGRPHYLYTRDREDTDAINTMFRYFSGLFHISNYSTIFLFPDFFEYFESIQLFEDYMSRIGNPKIELLRIKGTAITEFELIKFIDTVYCTDMISFEPPFRGCLDYHKINEMNTIQMWKGLVKEKDFLNLKSKNVCLKNILLTEEVLVEFVKKWLRKESEIESMILKLHRSKVWRNGEEVFGLLGTAPWNPRTRGRYYKWKTLGVFDYSTMKLMKEWDCSEGLDIVRSDGLLATIHLTDDTFTFFVWNQRFH